MDISGSLEMFFQTNLRFTTDKTKLVLLDDLLQKYAMFCSNHQLHQASNKSMLLLLRCLGVELHRKDQTKACTGLAWVKGNADSNHLLNPEPIPNFSKQTPRITKMKIQFTENKLNIRKQNTRTPEQMLQDTIDECKRNQLRVVLGRGQKMSNKYILCPFKSEEEAKTILSALGINASATSLLEQGYILVCE